MTTINTGINCMKVKQKVFAGRRRHTQKYCLQQEPHITLPLPLPLPRPSLPLPRPKIMVRPLIITSLLLYFGQNYLVITECEGDCIASATRRVTLRPSLDLNLSCGNNYTFTVKIQSTCGTGPGSNISVSMKPPTGAVTNLTIRFIAGNSRMEDAFLLRWNLPKQTNTTSIEVIIIK